MHSQPTAAARDANATRSVRTRVTCRREKRFARAVEGRGEERGRLAKIGGVDEDGVVPGVRAQLGAHEVRAVLKEEADAWVGLGGHEPRKVLARQPDHELVDLAPHNLDEVGMLEELRDRAAVAAADDEHAPRRRQMRHRRVRQHLVIVGLVSCEAGRRSPGRRWAASARARARVHRAWPEHAWRRPRALRSRAAGARSVIISASSITSMCPKLDELKTCML